MSVDNRTSLNDCESSATNFTTTGAALGTNNDAGNLFENANSVEALHSNVYDDTYTDETSAAATFSLDWTDTTVYLLAKDDGLGLTSIAGAEIVLGDGTNRIGYTVGGSDAIGMPVRRQFSSYKLDVSEAITTPGAADVGHHVYAGSEASLVFTTITIMGWGTIHSAKAQGNVPNIWIDSMTYIANGSYALTINGGTIGTPETMTDVVGDDETSGWGMMANPLGSLFQFFAPTEWGNASTIADVYFTANDEQWYWLGDNSGGQAMGVTHFPFRIVGNATDTIDVKWTNLVIVNTGTRAEFIAGDTDVDVMQFVNVTFTDIGAITFPVQDVSNKFVSKCAFNNCAQIDPSTTDFDECVFNGSTDPNGALLLDEATASNMSISTFNSDGTGHALYVNPTGAGPFTYEFDNWTFNDFASSDGSTGNEVLLYDPVTTTANTTINILNNGDSPSIMIAGGVTGTVTINNTVTVRVEGVTEGSSIVVLAAETQGTITTGDTILDGFADSTGALQTSAFNYEAAFNNPPTAGLDVTIRARSSGLANSVIQDDGGVFTDYTAEANTSQFSDVRIYPTIPVAGDAFYIGHAEQYGQARIVVTQALLATSVAITWEYFNGSIWTGLTVNTDHFNDFAKLGAGIVSWTIPGDWTANTVNSQGPFYYVRARMTAISGHSQSPRGKKITLDVTRYLPDVANRIITSTGLTYIASWNVDNVATPSSLDFTYGGIPEVIAAGSSAQSTQAGTFSIRPFIPEGTYRKVVVWGGYADDDQDTVAVITATYNGITMTEIATASVVISSGSRRTTMFYHDLSDSPGAVGEIEITIDDSDREEPTILWAVLDNTEPGTAEATDSDAVASGATTTTNSATNTTKDAIMIHGVMIGGHVDDTNIILTNKTVGAGDTEEWDDDDVGSSNVDVHIVTEATIIVASISVLSDWNNATGGQSMSTIGAIFAATQYQSAGDPSPDP